MTQTSEKVLHNEIRRLRELVERQFAEVSALRTMVPEGDEPLVVRADPYRMSRLRIVPKPSARTIRISDRALWPTAENPETPLWPNVGFSAYRTDGNGTKVIGFGVFGMDEGKLEDAVQYVEGNQRRDRDFIPLFLTDSPAIGVFRRRGYSYEYFPRHRQTRTTTDDLDDYAEARLELVRRKWGLSGIVVLGGSTLYRVGSVQEAVPLSHPPRCADSTPPEKGKRRKRNRRT